VAGAGERENEEMKSGKSLLLENDDVVCFQRVVSCSNRPSLLLEFSGMAVVGA